MLWSFLFNFINRMFRNVPRPFHVRSLSWLPTLQRHAVTNQCSFFSFLFSFVISFLLVTLKSYFIASTISWKQKTKANLRAIGRSFTHKRCETRENDLPKFKAIYQGHSDFSADATSLKPSSVNSTIKLQVEYHQQQTFNIAYHQPLKKYNCRLVLYFFLSPLQNYAWKVLKKKKNLIEWALYCFYYSK